MNYFYLIIIAILFFSLSATGAQEYKLVESESGKPYSIDKMSDELLNYDVIFFGELHDDSLLHHLEAEVFRKLVSQNDNVVLSMEMFERDNQTELTNFIKGKIDYSAFSQQARLWPNHQTDYQPLLQIAKRYQRDVIAANVPRRYASLLAKNGEGALQEINPDERKFLAEKIVVLDDRYKKEFYATMEDMSKQGMPNRSGHDMLLNIYKAQCLKDDTMAESIHQYLVSNPDKKVLHINGDFHSRYYLGTVQKLALMNKKLKIAVITPVVFAETQELEWKPEFSEAGDYLILLHRK